MRYCKWHIDIEFNAVPSIPGELDRQTSVNQESSKVQEDCRDLEEKDLTDLIEKLEKLMVSEKEKKPFYRVTSSAYEIAKYLSNKLSGPIPVAGAYLPYTFSKIEWPSLKYREYLDIGSSGMVATHDWHKVQVCTAIQLLKYQNLWLFV